jgi:hypothetical protein
VGPTGKRYATGFSGSPAKPVMAALLATGAGAAAVGHPLGEIRSPQASPIPAPATAKLTVAAGAVFVPQPVPFTSAAASLAAPVRGLSASRDLTPPDSFGRSPLADDRSGLLDVRYDLPDAPTRQAQAELAPVRTAAALTMAEVRLAEVDAEQPQAMMMMPAEELRVMMRAEVASRGSIDVPSPGMAGQGAALAAHVEAGSMSETAAPDGISRYSQTPRGIEFDIVAQVNGASAGTVPLLIADGGDTISVRLGDLLDLVEPGMERAVFASLSPSASASEYVSLNTLRESGIPVRFDGHDRLVIGQP